MINESFFVISRKVVTPGFKKGYLKHMFLTMQNDKRADPRIIT